MIYNITKRLFILTFLCSIAILNACSQNKMTYNKLTPEEERVILKKGTEAPFTGKYVNTKDEGTYVCRQCNAELYRSNSKFDSHCGWPSFDDEIKGAVKRTTDADGQRTEITCTHCGAHLGHVFLGEGFTSKNTRHCVNSISLVFVPKKKEVKTEKAIFAGGCFWGMQYHFQKAAGVISTSVGYTGGIVEHPSYKEVCTGTTKHYEAIEITFDPSKTSFETLAKLFFEIHDPTQVDGQGPDIGAQYLSAIFYESEEQKKVSEHLMDILKTKGYKVATHLIKATKFWDAENYHQHYYEKKHSEPYCHIYTKRF